MTMKLDRPLQLRSHLSGGAPAARADAATPLEIVDPWRGDLAATPECGGDSSVATAVQSAKAAYRSTGGQTDRKSTVKGKRVAERVDLGGGRLMKKTTA